MTFSPVATTFIERIGLFGSSLFGGLFVVDVVVCCLIGLVFENGREEFLGLISGGFDDDDDDNCEDNCLIGGLGGGEDSGEIAESTDFEIIRFRGDSLNDVFVCCIPLDVLNFCDWKENGKNNEF